jgi:hypothetical protein
LPLSLPVSVFSGVSPPPELLSRIAAAGVTSGPSQASLPQETGQETAIPSTPVPQTPIASVPHEGAGADMAKGDAPPSYDDAMADDLPPVDGPRRDFGPTLTTEPGEGAPPPFEATPSPIDAKNPAGPGANPTV